MYVFIYLAMFIEHLLSQALCQHSDQSRFDSCVEGIYSSWDKIKQPHK